MKKAIDRIARDILNIEMLELRNRDSLDFHDLSVSQLRRALEAAFNAGMEARKLKEKAGTQ